MDYTVNERRLIDALLNNGDLVVRKIAQEVVAETDFAAAMSKLSEPIDVGLGVGVKPGTVTSGSIASAGTRHETEVRKIREGNKAIVRGIALSIVGAATVAASGGSAGVMPAILIVGKTLAAALKKSEAQA